MWMANHHGECLVTGRRSEIEALAAGQEVVVENHLGRLRPEMQRVRIVGAPICFSCCTAVRFEDVR